MAEIAEYALAALVSTLLVGGSAATYVTFARFESSAIADASLAALVNLAYEAVERGHSSSTLPMPTSTVSCIDGVLSLKEGNATTTSQVPAGCDFSVNVTGGAQRVGFEMTGSGLLFKVG